MGRWWNKPTDEELEEAVAAALEVDAPPWAEGQPMPDPDVYLGLELFVAAALSRMLPFSAYHPNWALPYARRALEAVSEWEPIPW